MEGPVKVEIVRTDAGHALLRGGEPYVVRGAGMAVDDIARFVAPDTIVCVTASGDALCGASRVSVAERASGPTTLAGPGPRLGAGAWRVVVAPVCVACWRARRNSCAHT